LKPNEHTRDRLAWLRGMIRFYQADFNGVRELMPDPGTIVGRRPVGD
jgi:hypothetical protein